MRISQEKTQNPKLNYKERIKQLEQNYYKQRQVELEQAFLSPKYWQILNKVDTNNTGAFVSLKTGTQIPIRVEKRVILENSLEPKINYTFRNGLEKVGYVELIESPKGAYIFKVENLNQEKYKGINVLSDRIAVENCLKRGLTNFEITGDAMWNSHVAHYKSGKRFKPVEFQKAKLFKQIYGTDNPNLIIKNIIENTPKGKKCYTEALKNIEFYLPRDLINKYIKISRLKPILK